MKIPITSTKVILIIIVLIAFITLIATERYLFDDGSATATTAQTASRQQTAEDAEQSPPAIPAQNRPPESTQPDGTGQLGTVQSMTTVQSPPNAAVLENTGTSTGAVIGYIWQSDAGSPKFASVILPIWGLGGSGFNTHEYDIYIWTDNKFVFYQKARALVDKVAFPQGGVSKFEVLGIDPALGICATDKIYTWGMTFVTSGRLEAARTPITTQQSNSNCAKAL